IAILLCLLLFALPLVGCGNAVTPNKKVQAAERVDARLVEGNTDFAFRLFEQLQEPTGDANTFFSPTSIAFALSMVYNGAAGETKTEMAQAMGIESLTLEELNKANADLLSILQNPDSKVETNIANSLWPDDDAHMMADFMQRNRDYYDAEVETLDYAQSDAYAIINNWVEEKTEGKIKDLFEPLDADTRLVLVNALYFNGEWTEAFAEELTQSADFTLNDGSTKSVPLMHKDTTLASLEEDSFNAVRLPYGKERLSMYVFVPTENLADFYQQLSAENWEAWMSSFTEREVQVFLPRFKAEYKQELNDALQQLGMKEAFNPSLANFSTMAEEELFVSKVIHQAYIDVHEKGTEAAAATGVEMRLTSVQDDPFTVRADQPFFFAIRDDLTDTILFMGEVTNP
ncbi:MAG: serpin family protein, partial [Firmicutes bacterium]|nr:serpin family protein [Bacillota bacterium]